MRAYGEMEQHGKYTLEDFGGWSEQFPGHKLHKNRPRCLCTLWRELACYYPHSERIYVLPKGKSKKENGGNAHEGTGIYEEARDRRVKGEDF